MFRRDCAVDILFIPCESRYKSDVLGWVAPMGRHMRSSSGRRIGRPVVTIGVIAALVALPAVAGAAPQQPPRPTPEQRAAALVAQMTLDEKISQMHTTDKGAGG